MSLRAPGIALFVSLALLGALVLGVVGAPWDDAAAAAVPAASPAAGGSVCVAGGGATEPTIDVVLAAPPAASGAESDASRAPRSGRGILLAVGESIGRTAVGPYDADSIAVVEADLGIDGWVWAGWADHPLVAWREWRSPGGPGEPRASVVSRCIAAEAPEWAVLGLRTDGGNEALLDIVNPYAVDATFAVLLRTEAGTFAPIALRNVSVPAGQRVTVRLNDHLPEEPELAAVVTVGAGRLAVEGRLRATAGVGGIEGIATVPALTAPAVTWTFPWIVTGPEVDGAVWLLNPEPRQVVVEAIVHGPQGAGPSELLESIVLPAGGLVRVDAADLAPEGRVLFGLTLRSETTGVFAAAGVRFQAGDARQTGLVGFIGSSSPDREWLDAGLHAPGRTTVLHVINLAEVPAELRVSLTTAASPVAASGDDAPDGTGAAPYGAAVTRVLEPGALAPGAVTRIVLPLEGRGAWSAVVTGGEALVVARTVTGVELLEPIAIDALPSRAWRAPTVVTSRRRFDGWVARLGTSGDLRRSVPAGSRPEDVLPGASLPAG